MENHYHLSIETPDGNLSVGMRDLNGNYAQFFNNKYNTVGHLFQGRFSSHLIEQETYLLEIARYIVLNPVRAGIVDKPEKYKWSSFQATAGVVKEPDCLSVNWILGLFSKNRKAAQEKYVEFVSDGIGRESPFKEARGNILGSMQFIHEIWKCADGIETLKEITRNERIIGRPSLDELFDDNDLLDDRNGMIITAKIRCGYSLSEIAKHLGIHRSTVSKIFNKWKSDSSRHDPC